MNTDEVITEKTLDTAGRLHRSCLRLLRLLRDHRPVEGLSSAKVGVLGYMYRQGAATVSTVAAYLRVQPQSLTRLIAGLERDGLLRRRINPADRRQAFLEITGDGTRILLENIGGQRQKTARAMAEQLTDTEQDLLRLAAGLMDRLASSVESMDDNSDPSGDPGDRPGGAG